MSLLSDAFLELGFFNSAKAVLPKDNGEKVCWVQLIEDLSMKEGDLGSVYPVLETSRHFPRPQEPPANPSKQSQPVVETYHHPQEERLKKNPKRKRISALPIVKPNGLSQTDSKRLEEDTVAPCAQVCE